MPKFAAREPAMWAALAAALVQGAGLLFHWTTGQQGAINAAVVALLGVAVAAMVHDGLSAVALGAVQAVLNLVLAFGVHLGQPEQAAIMALAAALAGMFVRTQAIAKVRATLPGPRG